MTDLDDHLGDQVMQYRYDAFGNLFSGITAPYNTLGLTGKAYDPKAGLVDFSARWYDPAVGRFTQPDPFRGFVGEPASLHRYAYASNNPINRVDRWGYYDAWEGDGGGGDPGDGDTGGTGGTGGGGSTGGGGNTGGGGGTTPPTGTDPVTNPNNPDDGNNGTIPDTQDPNAGGGGNDPNPGGGGDPDDDDGGHHHHEPTASEVAPGKYQTVQYIAGEQAKSTLKEKLDTASTLLTWASVGLFVATTVALIAAPALLPALSVVGALVTGASMLTTYVQKKNGFVDPTEANLSLAAGAVSLAVGNALAGKALGSLIGDAKGATLVTTTLSRTWSAISTVGGAVAAE